jgi:hypothetical protein
VYALHFRDFDAAVSCTDLLIVIDQHRVAEAELLNAFCNLLDLRL